VFEPQQPGLPQMVGHLVAEDLQRALDTCTGSHRSPGGTPQVRVVEVGQPGRRCPHLAAHPALLPGQHGGVGAHPGEQRGDRVPITDDDPVDLAHLTCFRRDIEPAGRPDQRQRGFRAGAGDLESHGPSGLGQ